ncbi:hypothetical protein GCM10023231_03670 [Olivibacter ginsenosidimutans]|uniref:O-antigen ligase-related domain-containing protein n=1 Tax=Olivibacter ginsenosidimutans TaxID=1176537 RepID=A0ABP9AE50_9SPHI
METLSDKSKASTVERLAEILFCLSLFSVFLPWKIYPIVFLCSAIIYLTVSYKQSAATLKQGLKNPWFLSLLVFTLYASISYLLTFDGRAQITTNFIKLLINVLFFCAAIFWLSARDNRRLLGNIDRCLHLIFILCLLQLLLYHQHFHFNLLSGASSSAKGSMLYQEEFFFWGLADKNMFGARIALLGFAYILIPLIQKNSIHCWRIVFIFLLAYLSLSRTPIVALLIGVFLLFWLFSNRTVKITLIGLSCIVLPVVIHKLIRIDQLTSSNDGMGVRITYWKAFFQHIDAISPLGNGFLKGGEFLQHYAAYYHGEPHIHNTFLSCYLEFGWVGFLSYSLFLGFFYRYCMNRNQVHSFWLAAFLPLLAIMMILYSGYDNDIILYLLLIFILGTNRKIAIDTVKIKG